MTAVEDTLVSSVSILAILVSLPEGDAHDGLGLVPYLARITFADNLNRIRWRMNPQTG